MMKILVLWRKAKIEQLRIGMKKISSSGDKRVDSTRTNTKAT